ncbi:DUF6682 family protein [Methylomagnum ishizawai]|uniref:phage adaptor protein n=1 Tax=Methylomagnum ishizawai TaxID=1760988 RepID=UPI001C325408|nr:DUF6682 family protein [Methylomagnum ishizawai]BBL74181.1 hypothetical protein MishRS11D_12790 [Methylomagnum ishizawai]
MKIADDVLAEQFSGGRGIGLAEMEVVRAYNPGWSADTPSVTVENFMYDERKPTVFYTYPPAGDPAAGDYTLVELVYVRVPTKVVALSDPIPLADQYANALLYGVLRRAAQKAQKPDLARDWERQFAEALGIKLKNLVGGSPNVRNQGGAGVPGFGSQ